MKTTLVFVISVLMLAVTATGISWYLDIGGFSAQQRKNKVIDPDIPNFLQKSKMNYSKEDFLRMRSEGIALKRGIVKDQPFDPALRAQAINKMKRQEDELQRQTPTAVREQFLASWTPIGPAPIPNGQVTTGPNTPVSGRVTAIAIHPTNPNIVYVGAAQGGIYRSTDGGTNWTAIFDNAQSLAIGALTLAPSSPNTLYVGTGEPNFSLDSFFGVGVYRIDNASTTATLNGPFGGAQFGGRAIGEIVVHPTVPGTIFVASTSGLAGIRPANSTFPNRGVYRSTNATAAAPTFSQIGVLANPNDNFSVRDMAIDPTDPNIMVVNLVVGTGGLYRTTNALSATPTWTNVLTFTGGSTSDLTAELASQRSGGAMNATFYAGTGFGGGRVYRSTDGGATWTQQIDNNFCTPQCFYDIAIAVDPTNPANVYLGGAPAIISASSTDSGVTFTDNNTSVHVDTHAMEVAPSSPSTVYLGTDGGIYKSTNSGATWTNLNNSQFSATQFMGLDVHPTDANFTLGGTQDNGSNLFLANRTWTRTDFGDGGYAVIGQNASESPANLSAVRMYHTYFNNSTLQGYATTTSPTAFQNWNFRGCSGGAPGNGITCNSAVNFYAPLERGPGNPNTIYYGTDRLYRSADSGTNHTLASQGPIVMDVPVSSIGISPQNDNVRIVGLNNGAVFGTSTGAIPLVNLDPTNAIPNLAVARTVVDPNSQTTAYVTLSAFGVSSVWKTTNLNGAPPTWAAASTGLPQIPVNSFVVDPLNSNNLYAGTDIGVYASSNGGTNWAPLGIGLPRVAVFGMAITACPRSLRIATHGRGMYEIPIVGGCGAAKFDFDGDSRTDQSVFRPSEGNWYLNQSAAGFSVINWGLTTDTLVPGDYDGDGKTDIAVFRPSNTPGVVDFFILNSNGFTLSGASWGVTGDVPVIGDYDGDGKDDISVWRSSDTTWYTLNSNGGISVDLFGVAGDVPVVGDWDGDTKARPGVFRPSDTTWYLARATGNPGTNFDAIPFGLATDKLVPGDYDGDGKTDIAVFRQSSGNWFILNSGTSMVSVVNFGAAGDLPVPGDYDGDGKTDNAVYRPSNSTWFVNISTGGSIIQGFGTTGDLPIPNAYVN